MTPKGAIQFHYQAEESGKVRYAFCLPEGVNATFVAPNCQRFALATGKQEIFMQ